MNWEAIGAVGEILGAIGVIVTLAYLAVQIRHNTKVARSSTRQAISESSQALTNDIITNGEIADILVRHLAGEALTPVETLRLQGRAYRDMRHFENIHYQLREGLVEREEWRGFRQNLLELMSFPAYREYWGHESSIYSEAFQTEMRSVLDEASSRATDSMISHSRFVEPWNDA